MNILVACEESQRVTTELRKLGHEAYSCDILDPSGGRPEWHIQQDVVPLLNGKCSFHTMDGVSHFIDKKWDLIIAFPPCTHLAVSGAMHFEKKRKDGRQREGIEFFCKILFCDCEKQPEIDFVFRMRNGSDGVSCALFEADGGAWKFRAVHSIAEYLKEKLKGVENIAVLS